MTNSTRRLIRRVASFLGNDRGQQHDHSSQEVKHPAAGKTADGVGVAGSSAGPSAGAQGCEAREFFFARVPPTITYEELLAVFSKHGPVEDLNLFRAFAGAKVSKGCGIVRFASSTGAAAAKAALHDKHRWFPADLPMKLDRVNDKKKRSNLTDGGDGELLFKPKFLTNKMRSNNVQDSANTPRISHAGSCCSLPGRDHSSACSIASADGPAGRFPSSSSSGLGSCAAAAGRDAACMSDRARAMPAASGFMQLAAEVGHHSSGCNAISSGPLFQGATPLQQQQHQQQQGGRAGPSQMRGPTGLLASGQHLYPHVNAQGSSQLLNPGQQRTQQAWLQQWQLASGGHAPAAAALDEGCAGPADGALLASFRPLQDPYAPGAAAMAAAAMYAAAMTPTSLNVLAGGVQESLGGKVPCTSIDSFGGAGPAVLPFQPCLHDDTPFGGIMNPAAFEGVTMVPAVPVAGDSLGLSALSNNNECLSTYSNFLDGHPSMQLARIRGGASGPLSGLQLAPNCMPDAAAAADCSASLFNSGAFASGGYLGCPAPLLAQQQQQQQLAPQQRAPGHSGSNLQLTTGALYRAAGGTRDGAEEQLAELQVGQVMMLDDSLGYFDLYKSGSSLDSLKADDSLGTGTSSHSIPNKVSSCGSADTRHSFGSSAATALARQQQEQLLTMQEQRKLQMAGLPPASQAGLQQMVPVCTAAGLFGRPSSAASQHTSQWPLPQRQQQQQEQAVMGSLGGLGGAPCSGSVLPLSGSICSGSADDEVVTVQLPATAEAVGLVAPHLESIRAMSKGTVAISSYGHEVSFKIFGLPSQVQLATSMVQLLLQKEQQA